MNERLGSPRPWVGRPVPSRRVTSTRKPMFGMRPTTFRARTHLSLCLFPFKLLTAGFRNSALLSDRKSKKPWPDACVAALAASTMSTDKNNAIIDLHCLDLVDVGIRTMHPEGYSSHKLHSTTTVQESWNLGNLGRTIMPASKMQHPRTSARSRVLLDPWTTYLDPGTSQVAREKRLSDTVGHGQIASRALHPRIRSLDCQSKSAAKNQASRPAPNGQATQ